MVWAVPMDDRKRRVLRAIVTLYGADGEPVGSGLLAEQFGHAVSSATLRNEMAALTKLGLLEQPHTSAGRVPSAKGYRYYIDNLLDTGARLPAEEKRQSTFCSARWTTTPNVWPKAPQGLWRT